MLRVFRERNALRCHFANQNFSLSAQTKIAAIIASSISVDESQPISQIMVTVCSKMGIANHEEYSLVRDRSAPGRLGRDVSAAVAKRRVCI